jgi:4-amino-4-deoxy-L-arabinose transferase-like glycosyltransferase
MSTLSPRSRLEWLALLALTVGLLASLAWFVHPWYDPTNDGAMYILAGRSLAAGEGYSMLGEPFRIRPPGFAVMIAPILALRGTDFFALNLLVSLFGVGGCLALFAFARPRVGWPLAWLVALVLWLNPGYQLLCNQAMSDVPGTTLLVLCLVAERWAARSPGWRRDLALGLLIGLSAYVRTVDILLVPAILGARLLARWRRGGDAGPWRPWLARCAVLALAALLVQAPWSVRNGRAAPEPPVDQTLLYDYSTGMFHEDMGDPRSRRLSLGEVFERFPLRGGQALSVLGSRMTDSKGDLAREPDETAGVGPVERTLFAFGFLACVLYVLVKRRESTEIFVLGTLAIVSVYFGFAARLLLPIYVLVLPAAAEALRDLGALLGRLLPAGLRLRAGEGFAGLALLALLAVDLSPFQDWERIEHRHRKYEMVRERVAARVEEDDVLAAHRAWHYAVFLERPVYALEFVLRRTESFAAAEELIDRYGIDAVVVSPIFNKDGEVAGYFDAAYGPQNDPVARVYRVR